MANRTEQRPKGWPKDLHYLQTPSYSKNMAKTTLEALHQKPPGATTIPVQNGPSTNVSITTISDGAHPAHGQYGLFARRHLAPDSFILSYLGVIHGQEDVDSTSDYDLSLDRDLSVGIDASRSGNEARFINDYRGVTQGGPNAEFREVWVEPRKGQYERGMAVYVLPSGKSGKRAAGIKKGEEILVSYGKGFWSERQHTAGEVI